MIAMKNGNEKRQYFGTDLSYILDIGEIIDMHVVTLDSSVQVLRVESLPKNQDEYKTVRAAKPPKKAAVRRAGPDKRPRENYTPVTSPETLAGKLAGMGKAFLSKPMKRPEEW